MAAARVFGAIGVVEMKNAVDVAQTQKDFISRGVWVRPFGKLIYIMPQYVIEQTELQIVIDAFVSVLENH